MSAAAVLICESTNENSDRSENHRLTKEPAVNSPVALRQLNEKKERRKKRRIWVVEGDYIVLIVSNSISICLVFISNLVQGVECCKQDFVN